MWGWVWRGPPGVESNHNVCYTQSTDGGITWTTAAGKPQELPITALNCETAWVVPMKHDLINQTLDRRGCGGASVYLYVLQAGG